MKKIDGEISPEEEVELQQFLDDHPDRKKEVEELQQLKEETGEMKKQIFPEMAWEVYWTRLYNRLERSISWILISFGSVIIVGFGIYHAINALIGDTDMPAFLKVGIFALIMGLLILLASVIREKLMVRKHDKYKEIKR